MTGEYYRRLFGGRLPVVVPSGVERLVADRLSVVSPGGFRVVEGDDRFVFGPVSYLGRSYEVSWSRDLLGGGAKRSQSGWVDVLRGSEWFLAGGPLQVAMLSALFCERDGVYADVISSLLSVVRPDYDAGSPLGRCVTGSRVLYAPGGVDRVVHDLGSSLERSVSAQIVGTGGLVVPGCGFEKSLDALLGSSDVEHLNALSRWVGEKELYLWCKNKSPLKEEARALVLGVNDGGDGFYVFADGNIDDGRPARAVVVREIFSSGNGGGR